MMEKITRRDFVKGTLAAGLALELPAIAGAAAQGDKTTKAAKQAKAAFSGSEVRLAILGLGGLDIPGSVGGRGRQLLKSFQQVPGARVVALCDADESILKHGVELCAKDGLKVAAYGDPRRVFDAKDVDAVVVALPDHWHVLASIWACQAGKDVYCEKPLSYNIWEGRQVAAAAQKYGRLVQVGTQARSSTGLRDAFEFIRSGQLGKVRYAHVLNYKQRNSIGKTAQPTPIPAGLDYDLWCGPAAKGEWHRNYLHYDWHWIWETGTGETGNNGVHYIDMCRRALGLASHPRRVMSIGGRFGYADDGQTPNTNIVLLDFEAVPIICEIRGLPAQKGGAKMDAFRSMGQGIIIQCEDGYFAGTHPGGKAYDKQGKVIKEFIGQNPEVAHLTNFVEAVRAHDASRLNAPVLEGHRSAACSHMANISWRLGQGAAPGAIAEAARANPEFADAFARCREHLQANGIDLAATPAVLGPWVTLDPATEQYTGEFAGQANALAMRQYRAPYSVPQLA